MFICVCFENIFLIFYFYNDHFKRKFEIVHYYITYKRITLDELQYWLLWRDKQFDWCFILDWVHIIY